MNGEANSPRDLECLHDQAELLWQAGILDSDQFARIRCRIDEIAVNYGLKSYSALIADPKRYTVDITKLINSTEWLMEAFRDLRSSPIPLDYPLLTKLDATMLEWRKKEIATTTVIDERCDEDAEACIRAGVLTEPIDILVDDWPSISLVRGIQDDFLRTARYRWKTDPTLIYDLTQRTPSDIVSLFGVGKKKLEWIRTSLFLLAHLRLRDDKWEFSGDPDEYRSYLYTNRQSDIDPTEPET